MKIIINKLLILCIVAMGVQGCGDDRKTRSLFSDKPKNERLLGLDTEKPVTIAVNVQAAYNADTLFMRISWKGNRGDSHQYLHFNNGVWEQQGAHRRDVQSTLDGDAARGKTNAKFTSAESSVSLFIDDPESENAVPGFAQFGCFLACHDDSEYMPEWDARYASSEAVTTMYLPDDKKGRLDLWHVGLSRTGSTDWADDQSLGIKSIGGRIPDDGDAPFELNAVNEGDRPRFMLDGSQTRGVYAVNILNVLDSSYRLFMNPNTVNALRESPIATPSMEYRSAQDRGYVPTSGDSVPAYRSTTPSGNRADVSAIDTYFEPDSIGSRTGTIHVNLQRKLKIVARRYVDVQLAEGKTYNVAFAINTGDSNGRDHYVSFPMTFSLDDTQADITALKIDQTVKGLFDLPEFESNFVYPGTTFNVVLPGITSYEFLVGENIGKNYYKKGSDTPISQSHLGSTNLNTTDLTCRDCHTIGDEDFTGRATHWGKLSELVTKRGGVYTPTPLWR